MNNVANSYCDKSTLRGDKIPAVRFTATLIGISP